MTGSPLSWGWHKTVAESWKISQIFFIFGKTFMTNIIVDNVHYRWYNFCKNLVMVDPTNFKFFSLKEFDRFFVETKTDIKKYAFRHGSKVGATSNGVRTFTLTFTAFASDEKKRLELIKLVSSIFNPPWVMQEDFHNLEFTTPDGIIRSCEVQTTKRPRVFDYNNDKRATFEVQLVAKWWSMIFSKKEFEVEDRNTRAGNVLPHTIPTFGKYFRDKIENVSTNITPVNVEITVKKTKIYPFLYIRSYLNNKKQNLLTTMEFKNLNLKEWDKILVDSLNEVVWKISNEEKKNISNLMSINSVFPYLVSPFIEEWSFLIVDCGFSEYIMDVKYKFRFVWD